MLGRFGAAWGTLGVLAVLAVGVVQLSPKVLAALGSMSAWYHWASLVGFVALMAYVKGYSAFQRRISPRLAARARYLRDHPRWLDALLGPLFCLAFFRAPPRRVITMLAMTAMVAGLVVLVGRLPQPWLGIVDAGVVVGLTWGLVSMVWFLLRAFSSRGLDVSPEVPGSG